MPSVTQLIHAIGYTTVRVGFQAAKLAFCWLNSGVGKVGHYTLYNDGLEHIATAQDALRRRVRSGQPVSDNESWLPRQEQREMSDGEQSHNRMTASHD